MCRTIAPPCLSPSAQAGPSSTTITSFFFATAASGTKGSRRAPQTPESDSQLLRSSLGRAPVRVSSPKLNCRSALALFSSSTDFLTEESQDSLTALAFALGSGFVYVPSTPYASVSASASASAYISVSRLVTSTFRHIICACCAVCDTYP